MVGTCSSHERDEKYVIVVGKLEEKNHSEDLRVNVKVI
jgi:hypothetical protein